MDREDKIGRYMRDSQSKAESLYRAGYKEGWSDGYRAGKQKAEEECTDTLKREDLYVGDEVVDGNGYVAVVVNNDTALHLMFTNGGKTWKVPNDHISDFKKTGRQFDLTFKEMMTPF